MNKFYKGMAYLFLKRKLIYKNLQFIITSKILSFYIFFKIIHLVDEITSLVINHLININIYHIF